MISKYPNKMQKVVKTKAKPKHRHRWGETFGIDDGLGEQICQVIGCTAWRVIDGNDRVIEQGE